MSVELQFDRITVALCTVHVSAFEGGGREQYATVWLDDREMVRLLRHKGQGQGFWGAWYEMRWCLNRWLPMTELKGGLLETVSVVSDIARSV